MSAARGGCSKVGVWQSLTYLDWVVEAEGRTSSQEDSR